MDHDDEFLDKCLEGALSKLLTKFEYHIVLLIRCLLVFALNQGEVCTCPSRMLIQEDIYEKFMKLVLKRIKSIKIGHPLDPSSMMGAQASEAQFQKIQRYLKIGKEEGAEVLTGGDVNLLGGDLNGGYYIQPTIFKGNNKMRIFQEVCCYSMIN